MIKKKSIGKLHKRVIAMGIVSLMILSGCTAEGANEKGLVKSETDYKALKENVNLDDNDAIRLSVLASNQMGLELMKEIAKNNSDDNLLLSPTSLSFALAMLENGAEGETKSGILKVLREDEKGINERYNVFLNYLNSLDTDENAEIPGIKMKIANSLWIRKALEPKQDFVNLLKGFYNAEVYGVDFDKQKTIEQINLWVENQTNHLLKETIKKIEPETIAFLMNTVYFKGSWRNEFAKAATKEEDFYKTASETVKVDMMHKTDNFAYHEDEQCQVTSLPYYGGSSMILILPKGDLDAYLSALNYKDFQELFGDESAWPERLEISLPKFDYEVNNNLKDLLVKNGMERAFSDVEAEFAKMVEIKDKNVYVSSIFQNARINLDEKGTEAAAVTVVAMDAGAAAIPGEPVAFKCDKPFIYVIKDDKTEAALFIGVVRKP